MKISVYAVKNYQFTLVIFLMAIALGVTTLLSMSRSEDPELKAPEFPVVVIYPGTSPEDMEDLVVDKLEKKISELEDMKRIKTTIQDGVAVLNVEYIYDSDVDEKYQELVREVNGMRSELPAEVLSIEVQKIIPSNVNIIQAGVISNSASRKQLKTEAERLEETLKEVPELKNVEIHGIPDEVVKIELQLEKLASMKLPVNAILGAVQSELANIPGGSIDVGNKAYNIKTSGNYADINEINQTVVYSFNGNNIRIKDIANVYVDFKDETHITRINGNRGVLVTAALKPGNNISDIQKKYQVKIEDFKKTLHWS
jgi:multidrug efflux pump subunit AcrB